jgi:GNAT superfamily N-acetyltransferase
MNRASYYHLCKQIGTDEDCQPVWPEDAHLVKFTLSLAEDAHRLMQSSYSMGGGSVPEFRAWLDALLHDPEYDSALIFPVLDDAGRMIAFAQCWTSAFVKDLVVDAGRRKQGLGEALLRHMIEVFRERGALRLCLKVERDNPFGAERLYKRVGFDECPES